MSFKNIQRNKHTNKVLVRVVVSYLFIIAFIEIDNPISTHVYALLREFLSYHASQLLMKIGYANQLDLSEAQVCWLYKNGQKFLGIDNQCTGLFLMLIYLGFVVSYTAQWFHKLQFGIYGVSMVYFLNLTRIILLFVILEQAPQLFDVIHDYLFPIVLYVVVIIMCFRFMKVSQTVVKEDV